MAIGPSTVQFGVPYTAYLIVYGSTLFKLHRQRVVSDSEVLVGYEFNE